MPNNRNRIVKKMLKCNALPFKKTKNGHYYSPIFIGDIINPQNDVQISDHSFLIDTGASLCVLNNKCGALFEDASPTDYIDIAYGQGVSKNCPVYSLILKIDNQRFAITVVYDSKLTTHSLLGQYEFLQQFTIFAVNYKLKTFSLNS